MARCPLIRKCNEKVDYKKYVEVCSNIREDAYLKCETFKQMTSGTKKPIDWDSLFGLTPT